MQIIDSHVHFWQPEQLRYRWLDEIDVLNRPFLPQDYEQATTDFEITGLVFVQADCEPEQGLQEVDWVAALDAPVAAMVAFAPLELGDAARPYLDQMGQRPLVKGIRRLIQSEEPGFSIRPDFVKGVQWLAVYGYPFDICIKHHQLPEVINLVRQCPQNQFVLDHIGKPDIANGRIDAWRQNITTLAGFDNVRCKLSGMVTEADFERWTPAGLRPYIEHVLSSFGISRVMFGSDWPVVNLAGSFAVWMKALQEIIGDLRLEDKQKLFIENARQFYGIGS